MTGPELYVCSGCGKEKDYLSESWSTIEITRFESYEPQKLYFCLECRSAKQVWNREDWHGDAG